MALHDWGCGSMCFVDHAAFHQTANWISPPSIGSAGCRVALPASCCTMAAPVGPSTMLPVWSGLLGPRFSASASNPLEAAPQFPRIPRHFPLTNNSRIQQTELWSSRVASSRWLGCTCMGTPIHAMYRTELQHTGGNAALGGGFCRRLDRACRPRSRGKSELDTQY